MGIVEVVLGVLIIIFSIATVLVVLFQEGHQQNMGALAGGAADTFLAKNKSRSVDSFLVKWTRIIAIVFFLLVVAINAVSFFKLFGAN